MRFRFGFHEDLTAQRRECEKKRFAKKGTPEGGYSCGTREERRGRGGLLTSGLKRFEAPGIYNFRLQVHASNIVRNKKSLKALEIGFMSG